MSVKKIGSDSKLPFNYIVCIDLVVAACIVVVAGRPDGMAITVSAAIVAVVALVYRFTLGVKSYVARKADGAKARRRAIEADARKRQAQAARPTQRARKSKSWLNESD